MTKKAFTMAEVLITLGIIGIVAAMTLPTVINNARDRQFRAMFKKQVSVISQALQMIIVEDENVMVFEKWSDMVYYICRFGEKLNAAKSGIRCDEVLSNYTSGKDYSRSDGKFRWHKNGELFDKKHNPMHLNSGYMTMTLYLPDGAWINFNCGRQIFIDVNGAKNPNTVGRDIFYIVIAEKSLTPGFFLEKDGNRKYTHVNSCSESSSAKYIYDNTYIDDCENGSGWGCSPLYILR